MTGCTASGSNASNCGASIDGKPEPPPQPARARSQPSPDGPAIRDREIAKLVASEEPPPTPPPAPSAIAALPPLPEVEDPAAVEAPCVTELAKLAASFGLTVEQMTALPTGRQP
jgi:hypothetical protein